MDIDPHDPNITKEPDLSWEEPQKIEDIHRVIPFNKRYPMNIEPHAHNITSEFELSREEMHKKEYIQRLPPLKRGDIYLNRFRVKAPLGRGGFSEVYLVYDMIRKRDVALKLYRISDQLDHVKGYIDRDLNVSQRFVYDPIDGLIQTYEVGNLQNRHGVYICQQYIDNSTSLHDLLEQVYTIKPTTAFKMCLEIGKTLGQLHKRGVFHCDVKPLNVLLTPENKTILIDLGAARLRGEDAPENVVATIPYSSFELIEGKTVDRKTDVYSLGMTLLHLLVGLPKWVKSLGKYEDYSTAEINPNLIKLQPTVSELKAYTLKALLLVPNEEIRGIISKAIQIRPIDRYQSMMELTQALSDYLETQQKDIDPGQVDDLVESPLEVKDNLSNVARFLVYCLHFSVSLSELRMLCFELSIPYDSIMPPPATLPERILLLVQFMERHNQLEKLIVWLRKNRQNFEEDTLRKAWLKDGLDFKEFDLLPQK